MFWQFCGQYNVSWNDKGGDKYLSWKSFHISGFTLTAFTFCTFDADVCLLCINTLSCILRIRRFSISVGDGHVFQLPLFGFDYLLGRTTDFDQVSRSPTQLFSPVIPGPKTAKPLTLKWIVSSPSTITASPTPAAPSLVTRSPGVSPKLTGMGTWRGHSGDSVMPLAPWKVAHIIFVVERIKLHLSYHRYFITEKASMTFHCNPTPKSPGETETTSSGTPIAQTDCKVFVVWCEQILFSPL